MKKIKFSPITALAPCGTSACRRNECESFAGCNSITASCLASTGKVLRPTCEEMGC